MIDKIKEETLEQSLAMNKVALDLLKLKGKDFKLLWIALIVSLCINLVMAGLFLNTLKGIETETTTTTVTQDTNEGEGNNVYLSGESAQYHEKGVNG